MAKRQHDTKAAITFDLHSGTENFQNERTSNQDWHLDIQLKTRDPAIQSLFASFKKQKQGLFRRLLNLRRQDAPKPARNEPATRFSAQQNEPKGDLDGVWTCLKR